MADVEIPYVSSVDEIDLLIGSGAPKAFYRFDERKGNDNEIYAVRQTLGWELVGPKSNVNDNVCFLNTNISGELALATSGDMYPLSLQKIWKSSA